MLLNVKSVAFLLLVYIWMGFGRYVDVPRRVWCYGDVVVDIKEGWLAFQERATGCHIFIRTHDGSLFMVVDVSCLSGTFNFAQDSFSKRRVSRT